VGQRPACPPSTRGYALVMADRALVAAGGEVVSGAMRGRPGRSPAAVGVEFGSSCAVAVAAGLGVLCGAYSSVAICSGG